MHNLNYATQRGPRLSNGCPPNRPDFSLRSSSTLGRNAGQRGRRGDSGPRGCV